MIKVFLLLVDKYFPKFHKLYKCFNRNTLKATYCTLMNMKERIGKLNSKILSIGSINCWNKSTCSIPGKCNQRNVIYQADILGDNKNMTYFGSTENFKTRYYKHKALFNQRPTQHTTLSSYIWWLKDNNILYEVRCSIKAWGHTFSSGGRSCDLCLTEKWVILTKDQHIMPNKRDELLETCRHCKKNLLVSQKNILDSGLKFLSPYCKWRNQKAFSRNNTFPQS